MLFCAHAEKGVGIHEATTYIPTTLHLSSSVDSPPIKAGFFASERSKFKDPGNNPHYTDLPENSYDILITKK
jgi:hypothetical protein